MFLFNPLFFFLHHLLTCNLLSQNIKEGLEGRPARWYSDVFELIFPNLDREQANKSRIRDEPKSAHKSDEE